MAFLETGWGKCSVTLNQPILTLENSVVIGSPTGYTYQSSTDAVATIEAADYFASKSFELCVGDFIYVYGSDASVFLVVLTVTNNPAAVTTSEFAAAGVVDTANIVDLAVTTAKINDAAVTTGKLADNAVTTAKLAPTTVQYLKVAMTAAQFNGMYAAPFEILPAPGADNLIVVDEAMLVVDFGSAAYAAGGVFGLQYDTDVHGAGVGASETAAAAVAQWAADSTLRLDGRCPTSAAADTVNKSVCMSNLTGAFTTGDSPVDVHIWYKIVPAGL